MERYTIGKLIDSFCDGSISDYEWDDFISVKHKNRIADTCAEICNNIPVFYKPNDKISYCNESGEIVLKKIVSILKSTTSENECIAELEKVNLEMNNQ